MMYVFLARLLTMNVQTLAVINGFAVAGGTFMSLAHDRAIMNSNPKFKIFANETSISMPFSLPFI